MLGKLAHASRVDNSKLAIVQKGIQINGIIVSTDGLEEERDSLYQLIRYLGDAV